MPQKDFIVIGSGHNAIHLTKGEFRMAITSAIETWGVKTVRKIIQEENQENVIENARLEANCRTSLLGDIKPWRE